MLWEAAVTDKTIAELADIKAKMETRLAGAIQREMEYFAQRYNFTPADIRVSLVDVRSIEASVPRFIVASADVDFGIRL